MSKEKQIKVNEFGIPLFIDKTSAGALRTRVGMLKTVLKTGRKFGQKVKLSDKDVKRAEMHLGWYSAELRKLLGEKKSSKKSA